ncbi:MAG TPA: glycosyltransferase family 9 protein [Burkholderiaceae bacterium]|nr:glycosyltransferase family 9 protein [Burkholderiaceae bacterium]
MRSLIVRLPNHLGDACMSLPALDRLAAEGIALTLAARAWAKELFAAYAWPVVSLAPQRRDRMAALRAWLARAPQGRDALLLTNSFSSALDFRLAGLRPDGYATDGRRLLLRRAIAVPPEWSGTMHTAEYYLHLVGKLLGRPPTGAAVPHLQLNAAARERAQQALARARAGPSYLVLCPVAHGRHRGQIKSWSGFGRLAQDLMARGHEVVACPGPGEEAAVRAAVAQVRLIEPLDLGAFAALLAGSRLVIANDSGPGHLAAAVGARLVGIFGVTDPTKTRPLGQGVRLVGGADGWPSYEQVAGAVAAQLDLG